MAYAFSLLDLSGKYEAGILAWPDQVMFTLSILEAYSNKRPFYF
jgi:hypothetical protein